MEEQGGQGGGRRNPLPAGGLSSNAAPHRYAARHRGYGYMLAALEWHTDKGVRYLRVRVDGKTGGRWLIARHQEVAVLKRLHLRQADTQHLEFEDLFQQRLSQKLFRIHNGYQPVSLNGTFRRLLRDDGLLVDWAGKTRTLYSLRHTYATQALLANRTDIHTLARQMGNSAAMIERHYSKLTATMAADRLA